MNGLLEFDDDRSILVLRQVVERLRTGYKGFAHVKQPELALPPSVVYGSQEHANFLFCYGWVSRYGQSAKDLLVKVTDLAVEHPDLISPRQYRDTIQGRHILRQVIPMATKQHERIAWWEKCMKIIRDDYNGDSRQIMLAHLTRPAIIRALDDLPGIGTKIAQLIGLWLSGVDWPADQSVWAEIRQQPMVPTDIWLMRLVYKFGLLKAWTSDHRDSVFEHISDYLAKLMIEQDIPHYEAVQGLWLLGAQICSRCPGNVKGGYCYSVCPMYDLCVNNIPNRRLSQRYIGWDQNDPRQLHLAFDHDLSPSTG